LDQRVRQILKAGLFDVQSQVQEIARFLGIVRRLAELLPLDLGVHQICRELTRIIIEETGFENCSILLWDDHGGCLTLAAANGLGNLFEGTEIQGYNAGLKFAADEGLAGQAFVTKTPVFVEDSTRQEIPLKAGAVVRPTSLACLPLLDVGVLNMSSNRALSFTHQMRRYWEFIGAIIGYFLLGVLLHSGERKTQRERPEAPGCSEEVSGDERSMVTARLPLAEDALEHIPQGICLLDSEGKVTQLNRSIERSYGRNASELIGRSPSVIFRNPETFQAIFEKVGPSPAEELLDVSLVNADGEVYSADLNMVKMMDNSGAVKGYLLVINDVTKKKAFAEKMLQAEKLAALGTMAGGVAHDFNNLLMVILGNIQLLLPQAQDEEMLQRLKNIEKAVNDGAHTVGRLQKFTERDRPHHSTPVAADVNEAIKDVIAMTRPRWKNSMEKHGHSVLFKTDLMSPCFCKIHVSDCREVLTNLVLNAIEAMPQGGTITINTKPCNDMVEIEVRDTGVGMNQEVAAKIFDPFYTTKGFGNSGLGLSVSWSLIKRVGGDIQIKSRPKKGSLFTIKLPRTDPLQPVSLVVAQRTSPATLRLLVVDDDESVLWIIKDMLSFKGHEVLAVADARKALDIIEKEKLDLVITDLGMPGISGWEIARSVKAKNSSLPVMLLTGWGAQFEEEDLSNEGVDMVLSKPLSWDELSEGIEKLLRNENGSNHKRVGQP
jgi:PAS domain S-box-containing protein